MSETLKGAVVWRVLDDQEEYGVEGLSTTMNGYEETVGWWDSYRNGIVVDPEALRALVAQANRRAPQGEPWKFRQAFIDGLTADADAAAKDGMSKRNAAGVVLRAAIRRLDTLLAALQGDRDLDDAKSAYWNLRTCICGEDARHHACPEESGHLHGFDPDWADVRVKMEARQIEQPKGHTGHTGEGDE